MEILGPLLIWLNLPICRSFIPISLLHADLKHPEESLYLLAIQKHLLPIDWLALLPTRNLIVLYSMQCGEIFWETTKTFQYEIAKERERDAYGWCSIQEIWNMTVWMICMNSWIHLLCLLFILTAACVTTGSYQQTHWNTKSWNVSLLQFLHIL